ncbi:acyltransferase family protein [Allonocardiopsis opalescens]|uniref:Acyltransferase-like protein n=1 Tax=Allonocardiopsis opalescens TaxID=1144618 RepID=A0A2T0QAX5_9ACTN|nr:acyltransferase [Allonocardiopsis opalescens]PRY00997.1 acyltransferase-like protein [Allonocardiopsis opalescens]
MPEVEPDGTRDGGPAAGTARGWRAAAARIDAAGRRRDRGIDALRALAIAGVVAGHWLVGALVLREDGALRIGSALRELGALAPASWFLQMLALFFLVGGYSAARSLTRARERGEDTGAWLRLRGTRLVRPVLAMAALTAAAVPLLAAVGVHPLSLRTWVVLLVQPLWFILIYGVATALTPLAMAVDRRFGPAAAVAMMGVVAVVDLLRYGPAQALVPDWLALVNVLPAWLFGYQLGVSWASGRLGRRGALVLLAGGAGLFALLIGVFDYPASMVGVPGEARSNAHPASLLVPALAAVQCGAAILLRDRLHRALGAHPRLWAAVALANLSAMTLFCWHQTALVAVSLFGAALGGLPGLTDPPADLAWVLFRLAWLPAMALTLAGLVPLVHRFERPWHGLGRPARVAVGLLAAGFVGYTVWVY